jgi:hypothetical protein
MNPKAAQANVKDLCGFAIHEGTRRLRIHQEFISQMSFAGSKFKTFFPLNVTLELGTMGLLAS